MEEGGKMGREELAAMVNRVMISNYLSLKELAFMTGFCINTVQRVRYVNYSTYKSPLSEKTLARFASVISTIDKP
jgi:hypothetical protein